MSDDEEVGLDEALILERLAEELFAFRLAPISGTADVQSKAIEFRRRLWATMGDDGREPWRHHAARIFERIFADLE